MAQEQTLILNEAQVRQKIKRIAYEIYENNLLEEEVIVAGIYDKGYMLAQMIKPVLEEISGMKVVLVKVMLDKFTPQQTEISLDCDTAILEKKSVVLVDDVLNTGRTLAYSLKPFLNIGIKKLQTAVMVNRRHKLFPVSADFTGYELSTTLEEHITVELEENKKIGVYLH
jgi:pyrimidine operon attenuation protein / uracil phosphoribosyltransferase